MKAKIKRIICYIVDTTMLVLTMLLMGYRVTGNLWHEILGIALVVTFLIHCVLNGQWFKKFRQVFKKSPSAPSRMIWMITNILLIVDMLILAVSSVVISKTVFSGLNLTGGYIWKYLHTAAAYGSLILMSIHLGIHWKMILTEAGKKWPVLLTNKTVKIVARILAGAIAVLGVISSFERGIGQKFLMRGNTPQGNDQMPSMDGNGERPQAPMGGQKDGQTPPDGQNQPNDGQTPPDGQNQPNDGQTPPDGQNQPNDGQTPPDGQQMQQLDDGQTSADGQQNGKGHGNKNTEERTFTDEIDTTESLSDYLGKLYCTGCGKQCPLISPQCGTGMQQAQSATAYYEEKTGTTAEAKTNTTDAADTAAQNKEAESDTNELASQQMESPGPNNNTDMGPQAHLVVEGDENLLKLFGEYFSIMGLYICGTYYAFELIRKQEQKKNQKKKEQEVSDKTEAETEDEASENIEEEAPRNTEQEVPEKSEDEISGKGEEKDTEKLN